MKGIGWKLSAKEMLDEVAHLEKNICVISENKITLVIADNKIENKNTSYFLGSTKVLKLEKGLNKSAVESLQTFFKRNASCGANITVFHDSELDKPLGTVHKKGSLFIPPSICRESHFLPVVPECYRFTLTVEELDSIELVGFAEVISNYKKLIAGDDFIDN